MIVSRHEVPKVPRWKCEHPGCSSDAAVSVRAGPIGASTFYCNAHDAERFADFEPPLPKRRWRMSMSLAVGAMLLSIGAAEVITAVLVVIWCQTAGSLAPTWAATLWSNGILIAAIGLVAFAIVMLAEHLVEARRP